MSLNYQLKGELQANQTPVVLLHGLFGSLENLNMISRSLESQTQILAIDLPNHGRSSHSDTMEYSMMATQVIELIQSLNLTKVNLLGHSMGGKVAMYIALTQPQLVNKLVVADMAPVKYSPKHNNVLDALNSLPLEKITNRKQADEHLSQYLEELDVRQFLLKSLATNPNGGMMWRFNLAAITKHYEALTIGFDHNWQYQGPTLFIKGELSNYIQAKHKPVIVNHFPNSKAHVINGTGHWLHAEKPEQFNRIVSRFFITNFS